MKVIILHSAQVEESRAIMDGLGLDPQMNEETLVAQNGWTVSGKHSYATLVCPAFAAYPTCVVIEDGGTMRVKSPVSDLAECLEFVGTPLVPEPVTRRSRGEFLELFTDGELEDLKAKEFTIPSIGVFWEKFRSREFIDLADPLTIASVENMEAFGFIASGRAAAILEG